MYIGPVLYLNSDEWPVLILVGLQGLVPLCNKGQETVASTAQYVSILHPRLTLQLQARNAVPPSFSHCATPGVEYPQRLGMFYTSNWGARHCQRTWLRLCWRAYFC
jgi:hypothetical protein